MRTNNVSHGSRVSRNLRFEDRFPSRYVKERFETSYEDRELITERGFNLHEIPLVVTVAIQKLQWSSFVGHPTADPYASLVREFYAAVIDKNTSSATVRGKIVDFSPEAINEFYGLSYNGSEFEDRLASASCDEMETILGKIAIPGATWERKKKEDYRVYRTDLNWPAMIWYTFMTTNLQPTSHNTTVTRPRIILLDHIMEGRSVNVGKLIHKVILICATKTKGALYFPCLISELCKQAGTPFFDSDVCYPLSGVLDNAALRRFGKAPKKPTKAEPRAPKATPSAPEPAKQPTEQQPASAGAGSTHRNVSQHQFLCMQAFWRFQREQFRWQQQVFSFILGDKMPRPIPEFPSWILDEVFEEQREPELRNEEPTSERPAGGAQRRRTQEELRKGNFATEVDASEDVGDAFATPPQSPPQPPVEEDTAMAEDVTAVVQEPLVSPTGAANTEVAPPKKRRFKRAANKIRGRLVHRPESEPESPLKDSSDVDSTKSEVPPPEKKARLEEEVAAQQEKSVRLQEGFFSHKP